MGGVLSSFFFTYDTKVFFTKHKKVLAFLRVSGYTFPVMNNLLYITTKPLSYTFQGQSLWLEAGTSVRAGKNFTYQLPDGSFLFVPSAYVMEK
jgi:hypothetical protein